MTGRSDTFPLCGVWFRSAESILLFPVLSSKASGLTFRLFYIALRSMRWCLALKATHLPFVLRIWITFKLRQVLFVYAYQASLQPGRPHLPLAKSRYNHQIYKDIVWKYRYCLHTHKLDTFRRQFQWGDHHLVTVTPTDLAVASLLPI